MTKDKTRLDNRGREILDPRPKVVFMSIDPESGEVTRDGKIPPMSVEDILNRATRRFDQAYGFDEGDYEDDDFDVDEYDGSIPTVSPYQDGFVDSHGLSETQAIKHLVKAGYAVSKPSDAESDYSPSSKGKSPVAKKPMEKPAPSKLVASQFETASGDADE